MPHLTLRYSDNLECVNFIPFFQKAHKILCNTINVKPSSCSSVATSHQQYLIEQGDAGKAFIHLDVLVKAGKNTASLTEASQSLLTELNLYLVAQGVAEAKASVHLFESSYFSS